MIPSCFIGTRQSPSTLCEQRNGVCKAFDCVIIASTVLITLIVMNSSDSLLNYDEYIMKPGKVDSCTNFTGMRTFSVSVYLVYQQFQLDSGINAKTFPGPWS